MLQKLGLLAFVWLLFQVFVGAGSVWFDGRLFGGGMKARMIWKYHRLVSRHPTTPRVLTGSEDCLAISCSLSSS